MAKTTNTNYSLDKSENYSKISLKKDSSSSEYTKGIKDYLTYNKKTNKYEIDLEKILNKDESKQINAAFYKSKCPFCKRPM